MIPFENALNIVLESANKLDNEHVELAHAANRILAEDIKSDIDMPPCDRAVMDGFACRRQDIAEELAIIEMIPAGVNPEKAIGPKQCAKIMTGASIPRGADCVIMVEFAEKITERSVRFIGESTNNNYISSYIRRQGEDIKSGQVVLKKGVCIRPQHIAVLACVGCAQVLVSKKPAVAVIATGDELIEAGDKPEKHQLRNSNSPQLIAQLESIGVAVKDYGIAKDTPDEIDRIFKMASTENDVVLISGGVSMGDFDFVPEILKKNKIKLLFEKVAVKPGKPTKFGMSDKTYCFGLPGNPVSSFVIFELLVKPFLYRLMGHSYTPPNIKIPLAESIKRKDTERQTWVPVEITESGTLKPIEYHGSAHINALCTADGLLSIGVGIDEIEKGTVVPIRLI